MENFKGRLAILIPTVDGREDFLQRLEDVLWPQIRKYKYIDEVGMCILRDKIGENTIGAKRNQLTEWAIENGYTHRAFIDDDDLVTEDYLDLNMPGVFQNYDCNSLVGIYSVNGITNPKKHIFLHSLKYDHWYEDDTYFYRNPNHLNVCSLAKIGHVKFPESNFGEDGQWSEKIAVGKCLQTEYEITKPFYYYLSRTKPQWELDAAAAAKKPGGIECGWNKTQAMREQEKKVSGFQKAINKLK